LFYVRVITCWADLGPNRAHLASSYENDGLRDSNEQKIGFHILLDSYNMMNKRLDFNCKKWSSHLMSNSILNKIMRLYQVRRKKSWRLYEVIHFQHKMNSNSISGYYDIKSDPNDWCCMCTRVEQLYYS
jgi:hypothetical protein